MTLSEKAKSLSVSSLVLAVAVGIICGLFTACSMNSSTEAEAICSILDEKIAEAVSSGNAPSIQVAVVHRNRLIWSRAFGENAGVDRIYMNGSVQKVFDAAAVLQLVEKGLIGLDADVGTYVPFEAQHPGFPNTPVTVRMMLAHRSGLDALPHQFDWDTECVFSPRFRPDCRSDLSGMSLEEYLMASLVPDGSNYDAGAWVFEPGRTYHYSVSTYPFLRYLIEQVTGQRFSDYMQQNIFAPLGMENSGFNAKEFAGRNAIPYTRIDGENIELQVWNGNGYMMRTTAEDMARLMIVLMNNGCHEDFQLLQPRTIELMSQRTTRFKGLLRKSEDLHQTGHGLGLFLFRGGWLGYGGSTPGFQCLWRFNPSRQVGYVILTNVNAILGGGENYKSARMISI